MASPLISVIVDAEVSDLKQPFTYRVPEGWPVPSLGAAVVVPFGGQTLLGFVVADENASCANAVAAAPIEIKAIEDVLDAEPFFDARQWELARWMAERYYCSPRDSLRCIVPEAVTAQVKKGFALKPNVELGVLPPGQRALAERLRALGGHATPAALRTAESPNPLPLLKKLKERGVVEESYVLRPPKMRPRLRKAWRLAEDWNGDATDLSPKGAAAVAALTKTGEPVLQTDLEREAATSAAVLATLERKGVIVAEYVPLGRDPFHEPPLRPAPPVTLTEEQRAALDALLIALNTPGGARFLLHGVTASGKTEVYLRALEACAASGRQGLFLVPEISLTAQMMDTVRSRFGSRVAVLHSALSDGERYDEWMRIQRGEASVVVGARSAVFAPLKKIGLVILDEEHETSYKQESTPRYHTRDVAARRAQLDGGTLVLGSATPSVETSYWAEQGVLHRLEMPRRIDDRPMPAVRIVDLRAPEGTPQIFSPELAEAIQKCLDRKEQAILFLNRRGYATFVLCRDCGYTAMCPNCSVTLTYHHAGRTLQCHHCDYHRRAPEKCPKCNSERIRHFGLGTEKLEEETRRLFPTARLLRMDRDTTTRKGSHRELLASFREGDADILIGTQMVAKGLDFPRVTLVGVIAADTSLNLPDFRAAERSFALLAQVAGRAGRSTLLGEVIVQTFNPEHYSLQAAAHHDYASFYAQEIEHRRDHALNYPPFSRLANLVVSDPSRETARGRAEEVAAALHRQIEAEKAGVQLLGPAPAPMERIKNRYRWHMVLKAPDMKALNRVLRPALEGLDRKTRQGLIVDVDPMNLM
jgi:primosomal protein N' (replication factor Y)